LLYEKAILLKAPDLMQTVLMDRGQTLVVLLRVLRGKGLSL
jgi:hypothetical protein